MGTLLDKAFSLISKRSAAGSTSVLSEGWPSFFGFGGGTEKRRVNYKESLKLSAVYNAVDQISASLGIIPFQVYKRIPTGRERVTDHPVDVLLSDSPDGPDGFLTAYIFKKMTQMSVLLRGNALWVIHYENNGDMRLEWVSWDDVTDIRKTKDENGRTVLVYITKAGNFLASEVLHFKGFTLNGIVGISAITYGAMQMGVALEIQDFTYTNFEHKGVQRGVISSDKVLGGSIGPKYEVDENGQPKKDTNGRSVVKNNNEAKRRIVTGFRAALNEKDPTRVVVLDEGMKFQPISVTPQEAQLIESARFGIEDIARWFNIAPHKIKSLQQSTNNNIEQQSLDYLSDTMQPWVVNFEQECKKKLISAAERKTHYVSGNMNVLLRSDMKSRAEYYSKLVNAGIMAPNEAREKEEMNGKPGGDELRFPVNTETQAQIDAKLQQENNA